MPIVRTYEEQERVDSLRTPPGGPSAQPDAFGFSDSVARVADQLDSAQGIQARREAIADEKLRQREEKLKDDHDRARALEVYVKTSTTLSEWEGPAFERTGRNAFGLHKETLSKVEELEKSSLGELENDEQREYFLNRWATRKITTTDNSARFEAREWAGYRSEMQKAGVAEAQDQAVRAYTDPAQVALHLGDMEDLIRDNPSGAPPEVVDRLVGEARSEVHRQVIDLWLQKSPSTAKKYLEAVRDDLRPKDLDAAEEAVKALSAEEESSALAGEFYDAGKSESEMLAAIDASNAEATTKTRARELVSARVAAQRRSDAAERDGIVTEAVNLIEGVGADGSKTDPAATLAEVQRSLGIRWTKLSVEERNAVRGYLEKRTNGKPAENDWRKWGEFVSLTPEKIVAMGTAGIFAKYRGSFDDSHYDHAISIYRYYRDEAAGEKKRGDKAPQYTDIITDHDRVLRAARKSGIVEPTKSPAKWDETEVNRFGTFEAEVQRRLNAYERAKYDGQGKATPDEVQKIIDDAALETVRIEKKWFGPDKRIPAASVTLDDVEDLDVPLKEIPPEEVEEIRKVFAANDRPASEAAVGRYYGLVLAAESSEDDPVLLRAILDEMDLLSGKRKK